MNSRFISEPRDFTLTRPGHLLWSLEQAAAKVRGALHALDEARAGAENGPRRFDPSYHRERLRKAYTHLEREARKMCELADAVLYGSTGEARQARARTRAIAGIQDLIEILKGTPGRAGAGG